MPCGGHSVCSFLREELLKYFSLSLVGWLLQGKANAPVRREMIMIIMLLATPGRFCVSEGKGQYMSQEMHNYF